MASSMRRSRLRLVPLLFNILFLAEVRHGLADLSDFSACVGDNFFACNRGFLKIDVV